MNRRIFTSCSLALLLVASLGCDGKQRTAPASEGAPSKVELEGFHALATADGASVGAIFGSLTAEAADTLLSVSVPAELAGRTEIHQMAQNDAGQMEMRPVERLALPEHETLEMRPGSYHIMLLDLREALREERPVRLTLRFAVAGERVLEVPVRQP